MTGRLSVPLRVAAVTATTALVGAMASLPASAADGDVEVTNTETVQVYTSASGNVQTKRIYEQLAMTGSGSVDFSNPIETDGLRNLDGFGGLDVKDGNQLVNVDVDGEKHLRSVSDFKGDLPLDVKVEYRLDGRLVEPSDVVGEDGKLDVQYTVKNVTGEDQEVSIPDGSGGTITKTVNVPIPMVGSVTTTVPANFTEVASEAANMAGDGKGGTKLSFTMTLFPPIGSDTAEFGYTANITDGLVPRATISALPVNPLESPTFASAANSYQGGADTGIELANGAGEIDSNLLKLRDGAGELLAGLIKLRTGAQQLEAGLAGEASPGAHRLADGADQLNDGLGQLNSGSQRLAAGLGEASAGGTKLSAGAGQLKGGVGKLGSGAGQLDAGASKLSAGQAGLEDGLTTLYKAVDSLPKSVKQQLKTNVDYQTLLGALEAIVKGVGTRADAPTAGTLLGGMNAVQYGLRNPLSTEAACAAQDSTRCGALDGIDLISKMFTGALNGTPADSGSLAQLKYVIGTVKAAPDCGPICDATVDGVLAATIEGPGGLRDQITDARDGLDGISGGVTAKLLASGAGLDRLRAGLSNGNPTQCAAAKGTPTPLDDCGIKEAALAVQGGVPLLVDKLTEQISNQILAGLGRPTKGCDPESTLRCAASALTDGGQELSAGMNALIAGVAKLNAGGDALAAGAGDLSAGLTQLDDGANELSDGAGRAADGSTQLADGANELAAGLTDAADGSGQLAGGLEKAADGAPALENGAQRLSDEGTKKLVEAGAATAQNYGELYEVIAAGAERAQGEKMVIGAPDDAIGLAAYTYEIKGEDGEGGRNLARGLGGLALLGAAGAAFALRRRIL